ncbi:hypothetical protein [Vibrio sp. R78045]
MFKSAEQKALEKLAQSYRNKDKRLSWETCLKKAKQRQRTFNGNR